jgi:hypothetical protein
MNYCEENVETCKFIEINGCKLCVFTNGHIYRIMPNGDMKYNKGSICKGYLLITLNQQKYKHHRIIYYAFKDFDIINPLIFIDHVNRIKNDNRIENLRLATHQQNQFNRNAKGYIWDKRTNKWKSRIYLDKQYIHLGYFEKKKMLVMRI